MQDNKILQIRKRKGQIVDFDQAKIIKAIYKATEATGKPDEYLAKKLTDQVVEVLKEKFHERSIPAVEEIQDIVEEVLISNKQIKAAKSFILYRDQRARLRDMKNMVNSIDIMEDYLKQSDWRVKENSNMSYSLQGLNNHLASIISSNYWLSKVYTADIRNAHQNGDIHIHDLQLLAPYCAGWDLKDLLLQGFTGVSGKVESKPPKHFRTALGQVINFFYTLQGEVAGAEAFSSFDTYLAPFIRYDKLNHNEVKQCIQEFLFNINVPTRVGFQTPFTNITMDLVPSGQTSEENVIIGGQVMPEKYKDFQKEMDMLNLAFAEAMMEGDAKGRVFTFPIPTYNITKDFQWESPVAEKIFEMTAKYGIPYFSNFINSDMSPEDARSMCCRLRLDNRELKKRGGGLFGANPLTGSIGVVTINLPRIGYLSKTKEEFFDRINGLMLIARDSLETKRKVLEELTNGGLYPYAKHYLANIQLRFGKYWQNHFSTIGLIGMNEAMLNFVPIAEDITTKKGKEFALEILDFMREKIMDFQNETNNLYNLEATPGEGTTRRLSNLDREKYPDIIVANQEAVKSGNATPYYTNSTQLPVNFTDDLFAALDLQDDIQTKYTGGTVLHAYLGEALPSAESVRRLVKNISYNYHLPYFTITPTFSICPKHGYIAGEHYYCPKCDAENGYADSAKFEAIEVGEKQEALLITTYPDKKNDDKIEEGVERDLIEMIAGL
ncbi:MAG: Anaerobic ribonucleoside-triphosphate reductase [Candidatus Falkowbacteria bacterium GW2011_GWC2_38_22]|uniref:Anaerobic ribonucleoside-triphosphate reductase n=1 Tax=Candidatus Falkowbacteria bacterium GW2011_GWE1_38_31 TaxID=1618638 RepID=A0A0G0JQP4_9BACT|nr:MAG: Anaerobic ribonucleoside-triphosphate reductase [Candidatus Falkowbacteria bacterium GW2011_GWF2_38_1205]KKQ61298.1 MAG: Anaerobic ribonucleoside-triphosphate reductase [Candidatus Falkowbacteria bacterium GW2011_GWC2_38_22]KKQ63130.1 MAG: Anaerobic ribonucleoside-triphosphate reductase [Candidatus Falkowbacteria bacterium GW2011_GWF1_38_22]KKQ65327.1 MAG: Anaerobic ribonucleoside-triphosphate reductase [Candidatus Falkowbacteria bacterium GW2011_GWE2_38_254]KKQ69903.1 MAG: Anaerobic ri